MSIEEKEKLQNKTKIDAKKAMKSAKNNVDSGLGVVGTFLITGSAGFFTVAWQSLQSGNFQGGAANIGWGFLCMIVFAIVSVAKIKLPEGAFKQAIKNHESVINSQDGASFAGYGAYAMGTFFAFGEEYFAAAFAAVIGVFLHFIKYKLKKGAITQYTENTIVEPLRS